MTSTKTVQRVLGAIAPMGLIKNIFGGIFAFFGSILKVFGIGKSGYYVELPEEKSAPQKLVDDKAITQKAVDQRKPVEDTAANQPAPAKAEAVQEVQSKAIDKPAPVKVDQPVNRLEPKGSTAAAPAAAKPIQQPEAVGTFAPNFLVPTLSSGRRRPGPSLSSFLDMAKQMNPSTRG